MSRRYPLSLTLLWILLVVPPADTAAASPPDTSALEFLGFRAGASLSEVDRRLRDLRGGALRCQPSRSDPHLLECRATLSDPQAGTRIGIWLSAIDSVAGVLTVSGTLAPEQLDRWRRALEARYGRVPIRAQGTQRMLQWVRRRRMLRLTWRLEQTDLVASVSLVDGRVLDGWGLARQSWEQEKRAQRDSNTR